MKKKKSKKVDLKIENVNIYIQYKNSKLNTLIYNSNIIDTKIKPEIKLC